MKRLLCLVVIACFFMLSTAGEVLSLNHPYQWEEPSTDNESHPWGGEDNVSGGGLIKSSDSDYRLYTENWALDLVINYVVSTWTQPYRPHRSLLDTTTETTQPTTVNTNNRGN